MATYPNFVATAMPMTWRKITPLHKKLGARAIRFVYPSGVGLPLVASPALLNFRFGPEIAIDRIIGFTLAIQSVATASNFYVKELNTGWSFSYAYGGSKGCYVKENIETLPDEISLSFSFSAALASDVYLSFFNFEVVPFELT
jgi:hypothetical protein